MEARENAGEHWADKADAAKANAEQCKADKWDRRKRLVDALMGYVERVASNEAATDGELQALPGVADVCSRLL